MNKPGPHVAMATKFFQDRAQYLWVFVMKLASYRIFGAKAIGVAFRFLENFCTSCYNGTDFLVGVGTVYVDHICEAAGILAVRFQGQVSTLQFLLILAILVPLISRLATSS
jgi:hypothetical protein